MNCFMDSRERTAILILVVAALASLPSCGPVREEPPQGVTSVALGGGKFRITSIGQASMGSIEARQSDIMRITSCDAARIMLHEELRKPAYKKGKRAFKEDEMELLLAGEFCKRTGVYDPEANPES